MELMRGHHSVGEANLHLQFTPKYRRDVFRDEVVQTVCAASFRETAQGGWVVLRDPEGRQPNISLNHVPEPPVGRNRLHLDLYTNDRETEVQRLLALGATRHPQIYDLEDDFRVPADPDGTLFCVVQKAPEAR
jgi:hypothetical protein